VTLGAGSSQPAAQTFPSEVGTEQRVPHPLTAVSTEPGKVQTRCAQPNQHTELGAHAIEPS